MQYPLTTLTLILLAYPVIGYIITLLDPLDFTDTTEKNTYNPEPTLSPTRKKPHPTFLEILQAPLLLTFYTLFLFTILLLGHLFFPPKTK